MKSAVSKLETPEKPEPECPEIADSPRAVEKVAGRRSRIAKRALAVFRTSRNVSADRATDVSPGISAGNIAAWTDLEAGKLQASVERREQIGECQRYVNGVPLLNRRLSMGDERVDESIERKMSWDDLVRPQSSTCSDDNVPCNLTCAVGNCSLYELLLCKLTGFPRTVQIPDLSPLILERSIDDLQEAKATEQGKILPRPKFLERMAIQSVDLKPW